MEDVERLARIFPMVDPAQLDTIVNAYTKPDLPTIAAVLDAAAAKGKVPNEDYTELAAEAMVDDEVSKAGFEKKDVLKGVQAQQRVDGQNWIRQASEAANSDDVPRLFAVMAELTELANDILYNPDRTGLPEQVNKGLVICAGAAAEKIDDAATAGDEARLIELRTHVATLEPGEFQDSMLRKIQNARVMLDNQGTEYDQALAYVTDENNTPGQVQQRLQEVRDCKFDVTYAQLTRIVEAANAWFAEYEEAVKAAEAAEADIEAE